MRIFKYKNFSKWAKAENIEDLMLIKAVQEIQLGLFDANLGGGLYKKRVPRKGQGKSGGYRTLLAFKKDDKACFMHGFAKNDKANISDGEKEDLYLMAKYYLNISDNQLENLIKMKALIEVADEY